MRSKLLLVIVAGFLMVALFAVSAPPVVAGSNGQQLRIDVSCPYAPPLAEVRVTGRNQRGQEVKWPATKPAVVNARTVTTWNYWWVGRVQIEYRFAGQNPAYGGQYSWYGTSVDVPYQFRFDVFPFAVDGDLDCPEPQDVPSIP